MSAEKYETIMTVEAVYDNSDNRTGYFDTKAHYARWYLGPLNSPVTEAELWKALSLLPKWAQDLPWTYIEGERYPLSDHYTGQLETQTDVNVVNSNGRAVKVGLLIRKYWLGMFKANDDVTVKFPETKADFVEFVNREEVARQERKDYYRTKNTGESFEDWKARRDRDPEATLR